VLGQKGTSRHLKEGHRGKMASSKLKVHMPAAMQRALANKSAFVQKQKKVTANPSKIQADIIFLGYSQFNPALKHNEIVNEPPYVPNKTSAKGASFPGNLEVIGRVLNLSTVPGTCEPLPDHSGWRVKGEVGYANANQSVPFGAEEWVINNLRTYQGSFPIAEYVQSYCTGADAQGAGGVEQFYAIKEKWAVVLRGSTWKFKVKNSEPNLFRELEADGLTFKIRPRTRIIFNANELKYWVMLRGKEVDPVAVTAGPAAAATTPTPAAAASAPTGAAAPEIWSPNAFLSFDARFPDISDEHDAHLPESELIYQQEDLNAHVLVPIPMLKTGGGQLTPYLFIGEYSSPSPAPYGQAIHHEISADLHDFIVVRKPNTPEEKRSGTYRARMTVIYWKGDEDDKEHLIYGVKVESQEGVWRSFMIHNLDHYVAIMMANQDLPAHADTTVWTASVLGNPENAPERLIKTRAEIPGYERLQGFYTVSAKSLVPDYLRYFVRSGLRISKAAVLQEFGRSINYDADRSVSSIILKPTELATAPGGGPIKQNLGAAVIALGNGQVDDLKRKPKPIPMYHAVDGDILPLMSECEFFVMTSRLLSEEERVLYCGLHTATASEAERDAFFASIIEPPPAGSDRMRAYYWIFAARRSALMAAQKAMGEAVPEIAQPVVVVVANEESGPEGEGGVKRAHAEEEIAAAAPVVTKKSATEGRKSKTPK
jgi:hypothetical protein